MGGFLGQVGKVGATGAATAFGGPAAGAAVAGGLGALGSLLQGGDFYDMMGSGAMGAGGAYLGGLGEKAPTLSSDIVVPKATNLADTLKMLEYKPNLGNFKLNY